MMIDAPLTGTPMAVLVAGYVFFVVVFAVIGLATVIDRVLAGRFSVRSFITNWF